MTDDPKRPLKVFLCHAHSDAAEVRALYTRLKNDGVDAWLDKENIIAGQDWEYEIRKAVRESDIVIVCLSKQFNQKGFRQNEVRIALEEANLQPEGEIFIIPARLEECDYLDSLRRFHGVDLYEERGYDYLMRALRLRAQKIGAELQSKKSWLGSFTAPVKKPAVKKPETVETKSKPKPTPRKQPQFNIDPKTGFIALLGIVVVALVLFGASRLAGVLSAIESPTLEVTATATSQVAVTSSPTFTPLPPTLTFTPPLPSETPTLIPAPQPVLGKINAGESGGANLRQTPNGKYITTLLNDAEVEVSLEKRMVNGVEWLRVFATVKGERVEGWLLAEVLEYKNVTPVP
jgi:hypothetical protein